MFLERKLFASLSNYVSFDVIFNLYLFSNACQVFYEIQSGVLVQFMYHSSFFKIHLKIMYCVVSGGGCWRCVDGAGFFLETVAQDPERITNPHWEGTIVTTPGTTCELCFIKIHCGYQPFAFFLPSATRFSSVTNRLFVHFGIEI